MSDLIDRDKLRAAVLGNLSFDPRDGAENRETLSALHVIDNFPAAPSPALTRDQLAFALCLDDGPPVDDPEAMHVCDHHRMQAERLIRILAIRVGDKAEAPDPYSFEGTLARISSDGDKAEAPLSVDDGLRPNLPTLAGDKAEAARTPFDTTTADRHARAALRAKGDLDEYHRLIGDEAEAPE